MSGCISVSVVTEVDVDLDDIAGEMSREDVLELAERKGMLDKGIFAGEGGDARLRGIVDAAEREIRRMPHVPRELLDLMWHVHGRAIA
jgi:hypothetical protein